ncbi:hypothetical protein D3C80_1571850 [compost metagenome]
MIIFGFGLGMLMPVFTLSAQNAVSPSELGVVTATSTLFRNLGGTIGIAVLGTVMNTTMSKKMTAAIQSGEGADLSQLEPGAAAELSAYIDPQLLLDQPKSHSIRLSQ